MKYLLLNDFQKHEITVIDKFLKPKVLVDVFGVDKTEAK